MEIQPLPGEDPPDLPEWLQIPFLVPLKGTKLEIHWEKPRKSVRRSKALKAQKVRAKRLECSPYESINHWTAPIGTPLLPQPSEQYRGTLGAIMKSITPPYDYYVLTAGHVIPRFTERMYALKKNKKTVPLEVTESSDLDNILEFKTPEDSKEITSITDLEIECGFLKIKKEDLWQSAFVVPTLSCHRLSLDFELLMTTNPFEPRPRRQHIEQAIIRSQSSSRLPGLRVWKRGATTGLTTGYLVKLLDSPPPDMGCRSPTWGQSRTADVHNRVDSPTSTDSCILSSDRISDLGSPSRNDELSENFEYADTEVSRFHDDFEWLGVVKWIDDYHPFTDGGDSGGLVYTRKYGCIIPLGIHLARYDACYSIFLSLEVFCAVAYDRDLGDLHFPAFNTTHSSAFKKPGLTRQQKWDRELEQFTRSTERNSRSDEHECETS